MKLIERIEALAMVGATPNGISRAAGTKADDAGKALCIQWMLDAGRWMLGVGCVADEHPTYACLTQTLNPLMRRIPNSNH